MSSRSSAWGSTSKDASSSRRRPRRWTGTETGAPSPQRSVRSLSLFLGAALLAQLARGEEPKARPFAWKPTYAEGRAAAEERGRPFLLYFPPVDPAAEPRALQLAPRVLGTPPLVEGTRVGAEEILDLLQRFQVKQVPALLFLDRRENVVQRWEGKIPPTVWSAVDALTRRLDKREEEDLKMLRDARSLAAAGDLEGAYRKVAASLGSDRSSPETLAGAKEIEAALVTNLRGRMLEILAREGLDRDEKVVRELEALAASTAHRRARLDIEREAARLRTRKIGARR